MWARELDFGPLSMARSIPKPRSSASTCLPYSQTCTSLHSTYFAERLSSDSFSTPPNVKFEIDDIEEPWTHTQPFDYIHSRMMTSALSNWRSYLQKCYDGLAPGGYLELNEMDPLTSDDGTLTEDHALLKSMNLAVEAVAKMGRSFQSIPELRDMMVEIGFLDVTMNRYKWPTNTWPKDPKHKEIGMWNNENLMSGVEGFLMAPLTRLLGWKKEEVQILLIDVRKELNDRSIHAYYPIYSVWGRKPTQEEAAASA
nr:methyltransferase domain-containing protein [Colletotrichum truncatum]KAF6795099.1 methyltransferase domain-containing protein [Colletotrichum truncatum]